VSTGQCGFGGKTGISAAATRRRTRSRIRNEIGRKYGVAVIAVGAISFVRRRETRCCWPVARTLCALGRTHLYDPQWTLHAAVEQD